MEKFFKNKVVIITGSNQGIGKEMAFQLGDAGAKVVINGRNKEKVEKVFEEFKILGIDALPINGDISDVAFCKKLISKTVDHYGKLDVLINNAGMSAKGSVEEGDLDIFRKIVEINLLGSTYTTKFALPHLRKTKGSMMLISSLAGIHGLPYFASYSTSKKALAALAESLRVELYGANVHVGIAYVGFTETDEEKTFYNAMGELEYLPKRENVKATPLEVTAEKVIRQIQKRKKSSYHSTIGNLNRIMYRIYPPFVEFFLKKSLSKFK
jgi:NAD(P)-dependent dehydrogenase (short-subunit alcohol dehydrogenase family)